MTPISFYVRTPVTIVAMSALLTLAACGKKVDTATMPSTPANTAPTVTTPMPDTSASAPMGRSSSAMGSSGNMGSSGSMGSAGNMGSSGSMNSPSSMGGSMTTPTPGAATGSVPNNDSSPAPLAPASASR